MKALNFYLTIGGKNLSHKAVKAYEMERNFADVANKFSMTIIDHPSVSLTDLELYMASGHRACTFSYTDESDPSKYQKFAGQIWDYDCTFVGDMKQLNISGYASRVVSGNDIAGEYTYNIDWNNYYNKRQDETQPWNGLLLSSYKGTQVYKWEQKMNELDEDSDKQYFLNSMTLDSKFMSMYNSNSVFVKVTGRGGSIQLPIPDMFTTMEIGASKKEKQIDDTVDPKNRFWGKLTEENLVDNLATDLFMCPAEPPSSNKSSKKSKPIMRANSKTGTFKVRNKRPTSGNKFYNTTGRGGYSTCIQGEYKSGSHDSQCNVLPNCVGYASGRFNEIYSEITGYQGAKYASLNCDAEGFVNRAKSLGLSVGNTPREGAIMCWQGSGDLAGHVAVVEKVYDNNHVQTSESGWHANNAFWNQDRYNNNGRWGQGASYPFLGFIYNPAASGSEGQINDTLSKGNSGLLATMNDYGGGDKQTLVYKDSGSNVRAFSFCTTEKDSNNKVTYKPIEGQSWIQLNPKKSYYGAGILLQTSTGVDISHIVKQLATLEGWKYDDTTIAQTELVPCSDKFKMQNQTARQFINDVLIPMAITPVGEYTKTNGQKIKLDRGQGGFTLYFKGNTVYFQPLNGSNQRDLTNISLGYNIPHSPVISFKVSTKGTCFYTTNSSSMNAMSIVTGKEVEEVVTSDKSSVDNYNRVKGHSESLDNFFGYTYEYINSAYNGKYQTSATNSAGYSPLNDASYNNGAYESEFIQKGLVNKVPTSAVNGEQEAITTLSSAYNKIKQFTIQASMNLWAHKLISPNSVVQVTNMVKSTNSNIAQKHPTSGKYLVLKQKDSFSDGQFVQQLSMIRYGDNHTSINPDNIDWSKKANLVDLIEEKTNVVSSNIPACIGPTYEKGEDRFTPNKGFGKPGLYDPTGKLNNGFVGSNTLPYPNGLNNNLYHQDFSKK